MSNIFQKLELAAFRNQITPRTDESRAWFMKKARNMRGLDRRELMQEEPLKRSGRRIIGSMQMFFYDPKLKKKLPYYDTFPLVLPLENYNDGFLGLNFHYLPIPLRMKLLDRVVDFSNNTKFDESTVLNVSYQNLKRVRLIRPTLKRYLAGKVKSRFRRVDADEFTVATLLPVQRFKKGSQAEVYRDSRKMI